MLLLAFSSGCQTGPKPELSPAIEPLKRTEFTARVENYMEYQPLKAGKASHFGIHLTDLTDGSPVANAEVTMTFLRAGGVQEVMNTQARRGKTEGIYTAEIVPKEPGEYDIELRIKNEKLQERLKMLGFRVE